MEGLEGGDVIDVWFGPWSGESSYQPPPVAGPVERPRPRLRPRPDFSTYEQDLARSVAESCVPTQQIITAPSTESAVDVASTSHPSALSPIQVEGLDSAPAPGESSTPSRQEPPRYRKNDPSQSPQREGPDASEDDDDELYYDAKLPTTLYEHD